MKQIIQSLKDSITQLSGAPTLRASEGCLPISTSTTLVFAGTERIGQDN